MYDRTPPELVLISDRPCFRTIQTAVLIETLTALGAEVTWSSCVGSPGVLWVFPVDILFRTFSPLRIMPLLGEYQLHRPPYSI